MSEASSTPARPWLTNPVVDLLVGCGLLAVPLTALVWWGSADHASVVVLAAAVLSLFINAPHYAATIVRAARHDRRSQQVLAIASIAAVFVVVAAHLQPLVLALVFTAFLTWSPWHYATQNHGIGILLLARAGGSSTSEATRGERRALKAAHLALALAAMAAIHAGPREPFVLRLGLPFAAGVVASGVATLFAIVVVAVVLGRLHKRGAPNAGLFAVGALVSTSAVWFAVPAAMSMTGSLVYAGGAAAILHCAQYLWVTWFVEGRLAFVEGRRFDPLGWVAVVIGLGVVLFQAGPWIASKVFGFDLVVSLLIVQAVVNVHHFVVDAFVWKWRNPALAKPLFSGNERAAPQREQVSNLKASVATVVVVLLVLLGAVDVLQLAGTRSDASEQQRGMAAVLNDHDSRLWVQEAQLAVANNDEIGARADLSRAIELSPFNADAQRALVRLHVVAGRLEEAWSRKSAVPAGLLDEPGSDVTFADVALRTNRLDDAEALSRRALAGTVDDTTAIGVEARRVLGTVLLRRGQFGEARPLLRGALDDGELLLGGGNVVGGGQLLELALALGEAEIGIKQADPAVLLLQRVVEGAARANRADIAMEALVLQSRVSAERDEARKTLGLLQRALGIATEADTVVNPEIASRAWLDYGGLLARSDAPMRTRFVCALKARSFAEAMPAGAKQDELLKFIAEATAFVEEVMSREDVVAVRDDVDTAAKDALALSYPDDSEDLAPASAPGASNAP
jgi:hypothetical protein